MANSTLLFDDSTWIDTAFIAADKARTDMGAPWIRLYINDYNVGGGVKSQCALKTIRRMKKCVRRVFPVPSFPHALADALNATSLSAGIPIDGLGVQAHCTALLSAISLLVPR